MAIYQINEQGLEPVAITTFSASGIRERKDLQRLLRDQIEVISPDTLVIAEEFGEWEDSRRRIDLLGIDKQANLVIIELKRTEDGGHMELQAIRYAAMISALTFAAVINIYGRHLAGLGRDDDPEAALLEFLEWDEAMEDEFAQEVRIVLASAEFSRELTTSVIWLNSNGLDIRCIRLRPYRYEGRILLDVQQVIPLPEAEEYQVSIRNKALTEKQSRQQNRDYTKFNVTLGDTRLEKLPKRRAIFSMVKYLCENGVNPDAISIILPWKANMFRSATGKLNYLSMERALAEQLKVEGKTTGPLRYFIYDDELIFANNKTYAFHKMWGTRTQEAMEILVENFPDKNIRFERY